MHGVREFDKFLAASRAGRARTGTGSTALRRLQMNRDEILADYPDLGADDLLAALEYGALAAGVRGAHSAPQSGMTKHPSVDHGRRRARAPAASEPAITAAHNESTP